jgi:hypothetical protein
MVLLETPKTPLSCDPWSRVLTQARLVPCLVGVSGALLQKGVADLPIDMLLLEDVLTCEVNLPVEVLKELKAGSLAEAHKLVVDEAILDVVREIPFIKKVTPQAPTRTEQSTRKPARLTIL